MKLNVNATARYVSLETFVQSNNVDTHSRFQEYMKLFPERAALHLENIRRATEEFAKDIDVNTLSREW